MKLLRIIYGSLLVSASLPLTSFAQGQNLPPFLDPSLTGGGFRSGFNFGGGGGYGGGVGASRISTLNGGWPGVLRLVDILLGYFQVIVFLTALFYLLRGAFLFTTGKEKEAQPMILNAVIGIVVALLAFAVIPIICGITGAGGAACQAGSGA